MTLKLYYHPLSSFCHKVLIALYENETPFEPIVLDLGKPEHDAQLRKLWPPRKFPVLRDEAKDRTIPESSIIIEYLDQNRPGRTKFIPEDAELARQARFGDRFYDLYVNVPMQKIVTDKLRPAGKNDPHGVEEARATLRTALDLVECAIAGKTWAMGDAFSLADCAAAPSLFYASKVVPFADTHRHAARYLERLMARPSYARVLGEAEPYFKLFPQ